MELADISKKKLCYGSGFHVPSEKVECSSGGHVLLAEKPCNITIQSENAIYYITAATCNKLITFQP